MVKIFGLFLLILLIGITIYWENTPADTSVGPQPTTDSVVLIQPATVNTTITAQTPRAAPNTSSISTRTETTTWTFDEVAIDSLRNARVHGDERAPPILHTDIETDLPTTDELRDEAQYHDYEQRQEMKLKAAFVAAAAPRLKTLDEQLDAMRAHAMSAAAIAEAQAKRDALAQMTQRLQHMHPELQPSP